MLAGTTACIVGFLAMGTIFGIIGLWAVLSADQDNPTW